MSTNKAKLGDWVRFYRGGQLVIGAVQYVEKLDHYPYGERLCTDNGVVDPEHVLEIRRAEAA